MKKELEIEPPTMPNFVFAKHKGLDGDRFKFSVADFTKEEAEEYAELMKSTFLKHWADTQLTNQVSSSNLLGDPRCQTGT